MNAPLGTGIFYTNLEFAFHSRTKGLDKFRIDEAFCMHFFLVAITSYEKEAHKKRFFPESDAK